MTTLRLFSPVEVRANTDLSLGSEQARYVGRVLRLKRGDSLTVFDGNGGEYCATVAGVGRQKLTLNVGKHVKREAESPLHIRLVQGIPRGERMDFVVQKATELGVHRISPVLTERSVVRLTGERAAARREHWQKVARSACEQCRRNTVPRVDAPQTLSDWFADNAAAEEPKLILASDAKDALAAFTLPGRQVTILIGPEGGFSDAEHEGATLAGAFAVSLGPRILRSETAALAALCAAQACWGDFRSE